MTQPPDGRVAAICGRGAALTADIALELHRGGARIVLVSDDEQHVASVARTLGSAGAEAGTVVSGLDSKEEVDRAFERVLAGFGRIDVLVNVTDQQPAYVPVAIESMDLGEWRRAAASEPTLVLLASQAVGRHMRERGSGRIVNLSSDAAELCVNADGVGKVMVQGFTVGFARELGAHGITVNAVAAGPVAVDDVAADGVLDKQALKRPTTHADVGRTVSFLASEAGAGITGQIIHVNGGYWVRPA